MLIVLKGKVLLKLMQYAKKLFIAALTFLLFAAPVLAQPQKIVADKIAGIVGDKIILLSDIKNSIADIIRQGGQVPDNAECLIMEQALVSKVLMIQAEKDSLPVTDEEVEAELDQKVRYYINQLGSQQALEEMAGKTIYQIKDDARESVKNKSFQVPCNEK